MSRASCSFLQRVRTVYGAEWYTALGARAASAT